MRELGAAAERQATSRTTGPQNEEHPGIEHKAGILVTVIEGRTAGEPEVVSISKAGCAGEQAAERTSNASDSQVAEGDGAHQTGAAKLKVGAKQEGSTISATTTSAG